MQDIYTVRYANLRRAFDLFVERRGAPLRGAIRDFALEADVSERYLGHLLGGRKNIGGAAARKIEGGLALAENWLDVDHSGDSGVIPQSKGESRFVTIALTLYRCTPEKRRPVLVRTVQRMIVAARASDKTPKSRTGRDVAQRRQARPRGGSGRPAK